MDTPSPEVPAAAPLPSPYLLEEEAQRLATLYDAYVGDRRFLAESPDNRILYYVDSHEIKAFINPDSGGHLQGFVIEAERLHPAAGGPFDDRRPLIALRHDQVLSGLLFDPAQTVGLLPSHGEEMDDEVDFQLHRGFGPQLALFDRARHEIRDMKRKAPSLFAAADQTNTPQARLNLVRFFQTHAPVLTALLREDLDTSRKRLTAVLKASQLRLHGRIRWADLGVARSAFGGQAYGDLQPADDEVEKIRRVLSDLDYRRNSVRANWLDASALAHVRCLRAELRRRGVGHIRILLVSRARTLLRAAIKMSEESGEELLVRHPRLMAMMSADARKLDGAADLTLSTALAVYLAHLRPPRSERLDIPAATGAFLTAWDAFESSRLAVEVKWRAEAADAQGKTDAHMYQQLLRVFCSDQDAETVLNEALFTSFAEFGEAASRFLLNPHESGLAARLDVSARDKRVYVTPLSATGAGPIQVAAWENMPPDLGQFPLDEVARAVTSRSESILVWALALACAGRWKSAGLFAQGARQLAELQKGHQAAADEARLLRAQIRRFGGPAKVDADDDAPDPASRYDRAMAELAGIGLRLNEERCLREKAAQTAEAFLQDVDLPADAPSVSSLAEALDRLVDAEKVGVIQAPLIATVLMLHLMRMRYPRFWPDASPRQIRRVSPRHLQLVETLRALHLQQTDALSHRSRALALIGFAVFSVSSPPGEQKRKTAPPAEPGPLFVPPDLRAELSDLIGGLEPDCDGIAELLRMELKTIDATLRRATKPNLLLAPVRIPWVERTLGDAPDGSPEQLAWSAFQMTAPVMTSFVTEGIDAENAAKIDASLRRLMDVSDRWRQSDPLSFHVRMEVLYLRLLAATLLPGRKRGAAYTALGDAYRAISLQYPKAALPHCRLSYLAEEASDDGQALRSIQDAFDRVDVDPYLDPDADERPHWIQSLVRRRLAALTLPAQAALPGRRSQTFKPGAAADDRSEVEALVIAITMLLAAEQRDTVITLDKEYHIEAERRANNLIFYAARLIERSSGHEEFHRLNLDDYIPRLVERVLPDGIEAATDPGQLHSVGCYYAASSRLKEAHGVGARMLQLIASPDASGDSLSDANFNEALIWFTLGRGKNSDSIFSANAKPVEGTSGLQASMDVVG